MYTHIFNKNGKLTAYKSIANSFVVNQEYVHGIYLDSNLYVQYDILQLNSAYVKDGIIKFIPARPESPYSRFYNWNIEQEDWVIQEEQESDVIALVFSSIDTTRSNLALQPIAYDSKSLDADTQAQSNINGKLQEIFAREAIDSPLVSGEMFWKDADNVIHSWTNQTDYKLWLQGLVIAISSRNTALYATAWAKKAEVEALTDINSIINYNVNAGW